MNQKLSLICSISITLIMHFNCALFAQESIDSLLDQLEKDIAIDDISMKNSKKQSKHASKGSAQILGRSTTDVEVENLNQLVFSLDRHISEFEQNSEKIKRQIATDAIEAGNVKVLVKLPSSRGERVSSDINLRINGADVYNLRDLRSVVEKSNFQLLHTGFAYGSPCF